MATWCHYNEPDQPVANSPQHCRNISTYYVKTYATRTNTRDTYNYIRSRKHTRCRNKSTSCIGPIKVGVLILMGVQHGDLKTRGKTLFARQIQFDSIYFDSNPFTGRRASYIVFYYLLNIFFTHLRSASGREKDPFRSPSKIIPYVW